MIEVANHDQHGTVYIADDAVFRVIKPNAVELVLESKGIH